MSFILQSQKHIVRRARTEAGFNLIEAAIVLGIVGLIVGGIWAAASSAYNNMRLQSAASQVLVIAQNARNMYANNPGDSAAVTTQNAIELGLLPQNMVTNATTARSPWGNTVTVARGASESFMTITYSAVPQNACVGLLTRLSGTGSNSGIRTIQAGTSTVYNVEGGDLNINATDASGACGTAVNNIIVTVYTQ